MKASPNLLESRARSLALAILGIMILFYGRDFGTEKLKYVFIVAACAFLIGSLVYAFRHVRCPACRAYLGYTSWTDPFCPKCGSRL